MAADVAAARKALKPALAVADGVCLARDLVNEPPNVLTPETFAKRAKELKDLGVEVEVLGEKELKKLGMRALLGVGQGSHNESQVAIMRWTARRTRRRSPSPSSARRDLRQPAASPSAGRRHGGHEGRHGRRGLRVSASCMRSPPARRRPTSWARSARREHARRQGPAARRHRDLALRPDDRDHQHRRGRPASCSPTCCGTCRRVQAEVHGQPRPR